MALIPASALVLFFVGAPLAAASAGDLEPPSTLVTTFYLRGDATDVAGTTNGAAVTPAVNLSNTPGTVNVIGTGAVNFVPVQTGNGVKFLDGGQQNTHAAFYKFTGPGLASIFNSDEGEMSFFLKSSYTWDERKMQPALMDRYVMHVYDYSTRDLFQFQSYIYNTWNPDPSTWTLKFVYRTGGQQDDYAIPHGQEDVVFGKNVTVKVRLTWTATQHSLYLNDQLVRTSASTKLTPNWQSDAIFTFGSQAAYGGGFFSSDDAIDEFRILAPGQATPTLTVTPTSLAFGATKVGATLTNVTPAQTVTVGFTGQAPTWTATSNQPWLVVSGGTGTGSGTFTASIANVGIGSSTNLTGTISLTSPTAATVNIPVTFTIDQTGSSTVAAFGQVDTPAQGAIDQVGAIGVTGWALDDIGVMSVKIYRSCVPFEPPANCQTLLGNSVVYVGDAVFLSGARPDVEAAFPGVPFNYRAGWGMQILTNMLPNIPFQAAFGGQGTLSLFAVATDAEGHTTLLGRSQADSTPTTITMNNSAIAKPFGTADTPAPGSTVSGNLAAFTWALTPDADKFEGNNDIIINPNGSTMIMFLDGVSTAAVAYNQCRGTVGNPPVGFCNDDVSNVFGNETPLPPLTPRTLNPTRYRNLDSGKGPIGANDINTTLLTNGLHTIAWSVTDSIGRVEGIGSRFFTVLNSSSLGAQIVDMLVADAAPAQARAASSSLASLPVSTRLVSMRLGFDAKTVFTALNPDNDGVRRVALTSLNRLELGLAGVATSGHLETNGELRDLPVGSTLDLSTGLFSWVPPAAYFGTYRLVFVIDHTRVVVDVTVGADKTGS